MLEEEASRCIRIGIDVAEIDSQRDYDAERVKGGAKGRGMEGSRGDKFASVSIPVP